MAKKPSNKLSMLTTVGASMPSPAAYKQTAEDKARDRRYQAEDALRTITRSAEIQRDRRLMSDVRKLATEQVRVLRPLTRKR